MDKSRNSKTWHDAMSGYITFKDDKLNKNVRDTSGGEHSGRQDKVPARRNSKQEIYQESILKNQVRRNSEIYRIGGIAQGDKVLRVTEKDSEQGTAADTMSLRSLTPPNSMICIASNYRYPVINIRTDPRKNDCVEYHDLTNMRYFMDGSNSNIVEAIYKKKIHVVLKIIQKNPENPILAEKEFKYEKSILLRISHQNIVHCLGCGHEAVRRRRFLMLEWLGGGSLMTLLTHSKQSGVLPFTYTQLLEVSKQFAAALNYLHNDFHPDATIIHRDLKPDNIGFTDAGVLKLIDFGLCACVKKRTDLSQVYTMTGSTGSLRYMAPEVMREKPYTERVDIYSYALIVWQMATGLTPFASLTVDNIVEYVAERHIRPSVFSNPKYHLTDGLTHIITSCWDADAIRRMSADELLAAVTDLQLEAVSRRTGRTLFNFFSSFVLR